MQEMVDQDQLIAGGKKIILLVEDDETIIEVTKLVLESLDFTVLVAPNGYLGLELVKRHANVIDLVILDLIMPGMPGEDVLMEIKSIKHDLKVLIYSVKDRKEMDSDVVSQATGFLDKPFDIEHLKDKIGNILNS
ncbi:MAG: response regulator [Candidatus Hodarchaeota archaeon]